MSYSDFPTKMTEIPSGGAFLPALSKELKDSVSMQLQLISEIQRKLDKIRSIPRKALGEDVSAKSQEPIDLCAEINSVALQLKYNNNALEQMLAHLSEII